MNRYSQCFIILFVAALFTADLSWSTPQKIMTMEIDQSAPDFNLPSADGRNYSLADFAHTDILVMIFTCNHCPTAQSYEERIKKLTADYKNKGVAIVAISPNDPNAVRLDELGYSDISDSFEDMRIRAKDKKFNFPYLYDGDTQNVSRAYGPVTTPHVFIFDRERKLRYVGRVDDSENPKNIKSHDARNAIEALLSGKDVPVQKTKTFGCSIKWSDKRVSVKKTFEAWAKEPVNIEMIAAPGIRKLVSNNTDKLRLINVWASWCGPCVLEFRELITINRMYRNRNFELLTISADSPDRKDKILAFLKEQQASCKNFLFSSEDKYRLMQAVDPESLGGIPYTILVKPGGEIIYRHIGQINPLELKKNIIQYLGRYYFKMD